MSSLLHVEWTVLTAEIPVTSRYCRRCRCLKLFATTGKFRLNANGNRLDAWLIYRCRACGNRWNRSLFERRSRQSISKELLAALHENDPDLARRIATGTTNFPDCHLLEHGSDMSIKKRVVCFAGGNGLSRLTICNPNNCRVRLDKVLAKGLDLSRRVVHQLVDDGVLHFVIGSSKALKRPLMDTSVLEFRIPSHMLGSRLEAAIRGPLIGSDEML